MSPCSPISANFDSLFCECSPLHVQGARPVSYCCGLASTSSSLSQQRFAKSMKRSTGKHVKNQIRLAVAIPSQPRQILHTAIPPMVLFVLLVEALRYRSTKRTFDRKTEHTNPSLRLSCILLYSSVPYPSTQHITIPECKSSRDENCSTSDLLSQRGGSS